MTAETQRTLIAVGRKVVLAGLVLLLVWLVLLALRGTISPGTINQMNAEMRMESQLGQTLPPIHGVGTGRSPSGAGSRYPELSVSGWGQRLA